ncbi:2-succinyl-6-hydroxy-2,4-cyclohexadiene-1-carboxylate synthase [Bacillus mesophilum]|uniref:Putative 2-succinyl-6-hydroxy-2,4-cyclohexadiene-1-carboxylate synthase n=1 Tax=Bacillus mesophilum TaxID=1071718 RepID=A0A7V7UT83_9BACI|nr:2-succinyl-6-hydroxy-2,4-cyclohexadiene-1-carboxylate synthase [Bacillus mesophilum]KAB2329023.1 2-succinyl-6-hydroxy-2,4-cyclohexadiene-1-carboxylate synthase [Bacillus mesophilum]
MNFVIDSIRYHVDCWGKGKPLVLLHGFTGNSTGWREFHPFWASTRSVFAVDIIGHGQTESPDDVSSYTVEKAAEHLKELFQHLNISKADVLGYSMGGRLALTFALKHQHLVDRLILESATPGLRTEDERIIRRANDLKLAHKILENGVPHFVDYWENIPMFDSQTALPVAKRNRIREQRLQNDPKGLSNSLMGMGTGSQPSWWEDLANLSFNVLLITGELDKKFCDIADKMTASLPNCEWQTVKNCGHAIHVEKPEKFGTIVEEFLFSRMNK